NIAQVELLDSIRSIVVSMLFAILLLGFFQIIFRDSIRTSLLTMIVVLLFFSYGHVYQQVMGTWIMGFHIGRHRYLLLFWFIILLLSAFWLRKPREYLHEIGMTLNITSVVLILIPIIQIGAFEGRSLDLNASGSSFVESETPISILENDGVDHRSAPTDLPDIYYIILDMYTRQDVLENTLKYDNSYFISQLEGLGFFIASCSRSNYDSTVLSLGSSLNLDFFQNLIGDDYSPTTSSYSYGSIVKNSRIRKILESLHYSIISIESGFSPTQWSNAKFYLTYSKSIAKRAFGSLNPYEAMFLQTTPGILLYKNYYKLPSVIRIGLDSAYTQHRERILFELDELEALVEYPSPKFVFVHILAPHNPFVFGPNGEFLKRDTLFTLNQDLESDTWPEFIEGYTAQITYLNSRLLKILNHILLNTKSPPVIIIQGDHGIPKFKNLTGRLAILNAYYMPKQKTAGLYPSISPVNSFRYLLDTYFGTEYGFLEDLSYVAPVEDLPLDFDIVPTDDESCPFFGGLDY
ncbi:MAG: hypothetical protein P8Z41_15745, partial [Anaerolineales bacterium]